MLIAINGKINSGKDTVAKMINYLYFNKGKNISYTDYLDYIRYNPDVSTIIHFADIAKRMLSYMFTIPLHYFYERDKKDYTFYCPQTWELINAEEFEKFDCKNNGYKIVNNVNELFNNDEYKHVILIRNLIQEFAEGIKTIFGKNVWANMVSKEAHSIESVLGIVIIADMRFQNEADALEKLNPIFIRIDREENIIISNHISENAITNSDWYYDYIIKNNGTEEELFEKVKIIFKQIVEHENN